MRAEAAGVAPRLQEGAGVGDGGLNLQAVAHDAAVRQEPPDLPGIVSRDLLRIKIVECPTVVLTLRKHDGPAQARLCAFEDQQLEESPIVAQRHSPFVVVIGDVKRLPRPGTPFQSHAHGSRSERR